MRKLIVGNLKMNLISSLERDQYAKNLKKEQEGLKLDRSEIVICPPVVHLEFFRANLPKEIEIGAQNIFWERKGSFTGEISAAMVKNFGARYVILGHSERRRYFGENDDAVNLKVVSALKEGLRPIICVGETLEQKRSGKTMSIITNQVNKSLNEVSESKLENIIFAYEPVWAVGTDALPTPNEIMGAKVLIQKILAERFGKKAMEKVRILYGGSVSAETVKDACLSPGMDGALIGRESLTPYEFLKIAGIINK